MIGEVVALFAVLAMFGVLAAVVVLGLYMCGLTDRNYVAQWIGVLWEKWQGRARHRESRSVAHVATRARFRLPRRHVRHDPSRTATEHFAAYTAWTTKMLEERQHSNRRSA